MKQTIKVDLHCHSNFSDGILSPETMANVLSSANVRYASLTDHDSIKGLKRFQKVLTEKNIGFISGVEISVGYPKSDFHLLAYGFDYKHHDLKHTLLAISHHRLFDFQFIYEKTKRIIKSVRAKLVKSGTKDNLVQSDICKITKTEINIHDESEKSFNHLWNENHNDYITPDQIKIHQIIELIHHAGGLTFLPHPFTLNRDSAKLDAAIEKLKEEGLDGIEVFYKPYNSEKINILFSIAKKYDLLISAGSDFHGDTYPGFSKPGIEMPIEYWEKFQKQIELKSSGV